MNEVFYTAKPICTRVFNTSFIEFPEATKEIGLALSVIFTEKASDGMNLNLRFREGLESWDIICPNPSIADAMRNSVTRYDGPLEFETLTINKFLQDLFVKFYPEDKVVRKSHLLKYLATIWKNIYPDQRDSFFHQAFNVFTDLRSFTLNPTLIEDILEHYDDVVAGAIRYFWKIVESENLIDEHQAYQNILDALSDPSFRDHGELFSRGLIFTGFTHLSGNQVELLKFIGKYTDVILPIPAEVMKDSLRTDWVDWVKTQADIIEEKEAHKFVTPLKRYTFARGQGNLIFNELFKKEGKGNILFVNSSIGMKEVLEVPSRHSFYKSELDLFNGLLKKTVESLEENFLKHLGDTAQAQEMKSYLSELQKSIVVKKNKSMKDFLEIKLLGAFVKEIDDWAELSEINERISNFDMQILIEMTKLNLPRSFNIPILEDVNHSILSLKELYQIDLNSKNYIFADAGHDLSMGGATQYPKDVQEILISLGPMRRKGLDLLFYISQLKEILASSNSTLLLESGLEKHDPTWSHLLANFEVQDQDSSINRDKIELADEVINLTNFKEVEKLSPTRMQSYLECPRKYYYQYILKLGAEPEKVGAVDSRVLGDIEHKVVQIYLRDAHPWDEKVFDEILNNTLDTDLPSYYKEDSTLYDEIYAEVRFFAKQSIHELLKLRNIDPDIVFEVERKMESEEAIGSADVMAFSKKMGPILLDLKRSSGSIPVKAEVESLKKIQLWYYLNFSLGKDVLPESYALMGYINLSDPDNSLVFYQDPDINMKLSEEEFLSGNSLVPFKEDIRTYLELFQEMYSSTLKRMNIDKDFKINPETSASCNYCPGAAICSRKIEGVS